MKRIALFATAAICAALPSFADTTLTWNGADGVYARAVGKTGYAQYANNSTPPQYLGCDADLLDFLWNQNIATSPTTSGYGIYALRASVARVQLSGTAALGGALSTSNVAVEVSEPVEQRWGQAVNMQGGTFSVVGSGRTVDTTYGITDPAVAGKNAAWLTANRSRLIPAAICAIAVASC